MSLGLPKLKAPPNLSSTGSQSDNNPSNYVGQVTNISLSNKIANKRIHLKAPYFMVYFSIKTEDTTLKWGIPWDRIQEAFLWADVEMEYLKPAPHELQKCLTYLNYLVDTVNGRLETDITVRTNEKGYVEYFPILPQGSLTGVFSFEYFPTSDELIYVNLNERFGSKAKVKLGMKYLHDLKGEVDVWSGYVKEVNYPAWLVILDPETLKLRYNYTDPENEGFKGSSDYKAVELFLQLAEETGYEAPTVMNDLTDTRIIRVQDGGEENNKIRTGLIWHDFWTGVIEHSEKLKYSLTLEMTNGKPPYIYANWSTVEKWTGPIQKGQQITVEDEDNDEEDYFMIERLEEEYAYLSEVIDQVEEELLEVSSESNPPSTDDLLKELLGEPEEPESSNYSEVLGTLFGVSFVGVEANILTTKGNLIEGLEEKTVKTLTTVLAHCNKSFNQNHESFTDFSPEQWVNIFDVLQEKGALKFSKEQEKLYPKAYQSLVDLVE